MDKHRYTYVCVYISIIYVYGSIVLLHVRVPLCAILPANISHVPALLYRAGDTSLKNTLSPLSWSLHSILRCACKYIMYINVYRIVCACISLFLGVCVRSRRA